MIQIESHADVLSQLGLNSLESMAGYRGDQLKDHGGWRDVLRIQARDDTGQPVTLFIKRIWKSRLKDGLKSLIRRGRVWSNARVEFENYRTLRAAGIDTAPPVAFGEDCGLFRERFSCIITEAAGGIDLDDWLTAHPNPAERRPLLDALGRWVRRMHDAGLAFPDLFGRHVFITGDAPDFRFALIDVTRLDRRGTLSLYLRARDLAALNTSIPLAMAGMRDRMAFFRAYKHPDRLALKRAILRRVRQLLRREKYQNFATPAPMDARSPGV